MDGAGAAQRLPATVLGAGQAEQIAEHPQERHVGIGVDDTLDAVDVELHGRAPSFGQTAPVSIHARTSAPNAACEPGAGSRSAPGAQPHATSGSCALCSAIASSVRLPLRFGFLSCS